MASLQCPESQCKKFFKHLSHVKAGVRLARSSILNEHSRTHTRENMMMYTGVKPFHCIECGKCFTRFGILKTHIKIHTAAEKNFHCTECEKVSLILVNSEIT